MLEIQTQIKYPDGYKKFIKFQYTKGTKLAEIMLARLKKWEKENKLEILWIENK